MSILFYKSLNSACKIPITFYQPIRISIGKKPYSASIMKAVRIQPAPAGTPPYSATNPAPSTAIHIRDDLPIPEPTKPGDLIIRVKATTVIRDNLTWPELYTDEPIELGNDFAGVVLATFPHDPEFRPGDEVYGMAHADRGGTWAEIALVAAGEAARKPAGLSWEAAAALPLSALTADQALFVHAALPSTPTPGQEAKGKKKKVLVTGAAGGVGRFVVMFAARAGHAVVAATSSNARNAEYLRSLGATETIEYGQLESIDVVDAVIDTVGGDVLRRSWKVVKDDGALVSVDSASWNFVEEHREAGLSKGKEGVRSKFFIVEPSKEGMERISHVFSAHDAAGLVSKTMPMEEARAAYDLCHSGNAGRGKIVLVP